MAEPRRLTAQLVARPGPGGVLRHRGRRHSHEGESDQAQHAARDRPKTDPGPQAVAITRPLLPCIIRAFAPVLMPPTYPRHAHAVKPTPHNRSNIPRTWDVHPPPKSLSYAQKINTGVRMKYERRGGWAQKSRPRMPSGVLCSVSALLPLRALAMPGVASAGFLTSACRSAKSIGAGWSRWPLRDAGVFRT